MSPSTPPVHNISNEQSPQGPNLREPKASVILPPETMEKILEHIPTSREGRSTLVACALVATWWAGPSQRRLFSSVWITDENYQQWVDGVVSSGSKTRLLQYVRSFQHSRTRGDGIRYPMWDLPKDSGEYFSALHNVHSLTLRNITIEYISGRKTFGKCFSAFRNTLTELSLELFAISFQMFATFVDYFPNITTLRLSSFALRSDDRSVRPLSRPLRGKICFHNPNAAFAERLAELNLQYDALVIESSFTMIEWTLERVIQVSASTIKYLRLAAPLQREHPRSILLSLHHFTQHISQKG